MIFQNAIAPGSILDRAHPLAAGLVGFWPGNDGSGTVVRDISGHNYHGVFTTVPLPAFAGSPDGYAMNFTDAEAGVVNIGVLGEFREVGLVNPKKMMAVSFCMQSPSTTANAAIITYDNNSSLSPSIDWYIMFKTNLTIGGFGDVNEKDTGITSASLRDGRPHRITINMLYASNEVWVDGTRRYSAAVTKAHGSYDSTTFSLQFAPVENVDRYRGKLWNVMIHERGLSPQECMMFNNRDYPILRNRSLLRQAAATAAVNHRFFQMFN